MEVPLIVLVAVGEPVQVDKMDKPGAKTDQAFNEKLQKVFQRYSPSTQRPQLEK